MGFFTLFSILNVSPLLDLIIQEFDLSHATAGLVFSVTVVMIVIAALFGGVLGDRFGVKRAIGVGAILLAVGSPLRGIAPNYSVFLVFTAVVGASYGLLLPNLPKMVGAWFPKSYAGKSTGIYIASLFGGSAFAIAAMIPVFLSISGSWRNGVITSGLIASAVAVAWWVAAPTLPGGRMRPVDEEPSAVGAASRIWLNRQIWLIATILTLLNVYFYVLGGWLPTIFAEKGATPQLAGLMASLNTLLGIPANFIIPWISDHLHRRKPLLWSLGFLTALAVYPMLIAPLLFGGAIAGIVGFTTAGMMVICYILPVELIRQEELGRATGLMVSVGFIGGIVGPYVAGLLRDLSGGFQAVILLLVIVALAEGVLSFFVKETGNVKTNIN